jgi:hypothetical protein
VGKEGGDAWREGKQEVGSGGLHSSGWGSCTGGRAGEAGNRGGSGEEEGGKRSEGPMCKTKGSQGPLNKLIFPTDVEI